MTELEITPKQIASFSILKRIGKGGMGEVFLAHDSICKREVALKKIREDLKESPMMKKRFLREARIASQLSHPSIIPIYSIGEENGFVYYTMPYVEGETLKKIFSQAREQDKKGKIPSPEQSIPSLVRVFLNVCEAIAYTHAKGIIHRDIKPDNIIVGKYGEVLLLDWGIATWIEKLKNQKKEEKLPSKVGGTLTYLAPEIALGEKASVASDIYALGVILYQILTLSLPFHRISLEDFQKTWQQEQLADFAKKFPYREIPASLENVVRKCLESSKERRYEKVEDLIEDLKSYLEGRPEWLLVKTLDMQNPEDWEFREHILFAKHVALTRNIDLAEWFQVMLSKDFFYGNIKIEVKLSIPENHQGLGFLLSPVDSHKNKAIEEGYCLWLAPKSHPSSHLFRSHVLIKELKFFLEPKTVYEIVIEKVDNQLLFYANGECLLNHTSHFPLPSSHIGLLYKDSSFVLEKIKVFSASQQVKVNCLAVPDAFLSKGDYGTAFQEYQRIGSSFPGRSEGREALFRAGLALLEEAKHIKKKKEKRQICEKAFEQFERLKGTAGAILEYLGKSLVYAELEEVEEEAKCLELAVRRFPKHPLLPLLHEHIVYRVHESSLEDRESAYRFTLLGFLLVPHFIEDPETQRLLGSLQKHWEKLPIFFLEERKIFPEQSLQIKNFLKIQLAFRIPRVPVLIELIEKNFLDDQNLENAFFAMLELGLFSEVSRILETIRKRKEHETVCLVIEKALSGEVFSGFDEKISKERQNRLFFYTLRQAIFDQKLNILEKIFSQEYFLEKSFSEEEKTLFEGLKIWFFLLKKDFETAKILFSNELVKTHLGMENKLFYFLYGVFLAAVEGKEAARAYFSSSFERIHPSSTALLGYFLVPKTERNRWLSALLFWERRELWRELFLYYFCLGDEKRAGEFKKLSLEIPLIFTRFS